jgi:Ala-tRNA(Pro) deacylase
MTKIVARLQQFLDENGVEYDVIHHEEDFRARRTASDTHTPPDDFAKTVFLRLDGRDVMAVVPANHDVAVKKLREASAAKDVRLTTEAHSEGLCPDCEVGAAPPFGNLYDLPVYVSDVLAADEKITFNGGNHRNAVRMRFSDFERLVKPEVIELCNP